MPHRKSKYAQPPWHMKRYEGSPSSPGHWSGWHIKEAESGLTDVAYVDDVDYGPTVAKSHAQLFTAALELLAGCKESLKWLEITGAINSSLKSQLKAAIAKAEGETDAPTP